MTRMKRRTGYLIGAALVLMLEVLIGAFVHDAWIRPYGGDGRVTVLLCCIVRAVSPDRPKHAAVWVFFFSVLVELIQLLRLPAWFGLQGTVWEIALGATFDVKDIICYFAGCVLFRLVETGVRFFASQREKG